MGRKAVPWKNVSPEMEQVQFIKSWEQGRESFVGLCRAFDISRKTGYKRVQRFESWGWEGLGDLSRAPHSHPNQLERGGANRIVTARLEHPTWGPKKLVAWLRDREPGVSWPAPSTAGSLLDWGLVDPLDQRVKNKARKRELLAERAETDFRAWMDAVGIEGPEASSPEASSVEAPLRAGVRLS